MRWTGLRSLLAGLPSPQSAGLQVPLSQSDVQQPDNLHTSIIIITKTCAIVRRRRIYGCLSDCDCICHCPLFQNNCSIDCTSTAQNTQVSVGSHPSWSYFCRRTSSKSPTDTRPPSPPSGHPLALHGSWRPKSTAKKLQQCRSSLPHCYGGASESFGQATGHSQATTHPGTSNSSSRS